MPTADGFHWRFIGWRVAGLPMPRRLAPRIRARCFQVGGVHPWLGLVLGYRGRLMLTATAAEGS